MKGGTPHGTRAVDWVVGTSIAHISIAKFIQIRRSGLLNIMIMMMMIVPCDVMLLLAKH